MSDIQTVQTHLKSAMDHMDLHMFSLAHLDVRDARNAAVKIVKKNPNMFARLSGVFNNASNVTTSPGQGLLNYQNKIASAITEIRKAAGLPTLFLGLAVVALGALKVFSSKSEQA